MSAQPWFVGYLEIVLGLVLESNGKGPSAFRVRDRVRDRVRVKVKVKVRVRVRV
jgi:hypothetical protein